MTLGQDDARPMEGQRYAGVSVGGSDRADGAARQWSGRVHSAITLYQSVIRAGEMVARTPKGVVHLDVPLEYMLADWTPPQALSSVPPAPTRVALPADVHRLAERLVKAANPMIVAEHSGVDPRAFDALAELADLLAIPVIGAPGANFANFPQTIRSGSASARISIWNRPILSCLRVGGLPGRLRLAAAHRAILSRSTTSR